ncbi:MAG TPA: sulfotransferase [candidate division Zixibacteria bacterium]|nr:sulfotransferase [candidate division Zixibacteria bacterium]
MTLNPKKICNKFLKINSEIVAQISDTTDAFPFYKNFDRPIFILAPPRSGSTFLFECLTKFDGLMYLDYEADGLWWEIFPYDRLSNPSDYVDSNEATSRKIRMLKERIYRSVVSNVLIKRNEDISKWEQLQYKIGIKPIRYIDKTIANCFHLEVIEKVFPDACYIFLIRDPRANISSMIEGWAYIEKFGKPQLTYIIQNLKSTVYHWTYPAPPNWTDIVNQPLPVICAWSWKQHIEYVLRFFEKRNKEDHLIWVRYEDLVESPEDTIAEIANRLSLKWCERVREYLKNPPLSRTTISKPKREKWKEKNYRNMIKILPIV